MRKSTLASLAIVDHSNKDYWLIDCSPDFREQIQLLKNELPEDDWNMKGILLTHAHIGHYAGLIHLGREVMGAKMVEVFAMPRMKLFLESNGPWSQLVELQNIAITEIHDGQAIELNDQISITPLLVPHRDEFSETVGYQLEGATQKVLYIPDIDKWELWDKDIETEVLKVNYALLDATFFDENELPSRNMKDIPHSTGS